MKPAIDKWESLVLVGLNQKLKTDQSEHLHIAIPDLWQQLLGVQH